MRKKLEEKKEKKRVQFSKTKWLANFCFKNVKLFVKSRPLKQIKFMNIFNTLITSDIKYV